MDDTKYIITKNNVKKTIEDAKDRDPEVQRRKFVSAISHELRTPLTTAYVLAETLEQMSVEDLVEGGAKIAVATREEIGRLCTLVQRLLDVATIHEGREFILHKDVFEIDKLLSEKIDLARRIFPDRNISFSKTSSSPFLVFGDRGRIGEVFFAILENAIKFSPAHTDVAVQFFVGENMCSVKMRDEGIGIAHDENVFSLFSGGAKDKNATYPGMGMSMYVASHIIKEHGGEIWHVPGKYRGTLFCASLPLYKTDSVE